MKKVGIIRCRETEEICHGTTDFAFAKGGKGAFEGLGDVEIIGYISCGGCPGKKAAGRAAGMVKKGAEVIMLASCISRGLPNNFPCPNFEKMKETIISRIGADVKFIEYTH